MNVARHHHDVHIRRRFLPWIGQNSARVVTTASYKNTTCQIASQHSFSIPQFYTQYRHHFAASNPALTTFQRQMRHKEKLVHKQMEAKYGPKYRRRRIPILKFPEHMVKIEFMHSIEDVHFYHTRYNLISEKRKRTIIDDETIDQADNPGVFRTEWSQSSILGVAFDYYGRDCKDILEYYNHETNDWKPLPEDMSTHTELEQLYKGKGNRTMPLRMPSDYDDGYASDDDIDMVNVSKGETSEHAESEAVAIVIRRLIDILRREHYVRVSDTTIGRRHTTAHDSTVRMEHPDDEIVTVTIINSSDDGNDNEQEESTAASSDTIDGHIDDDSNGGEMIIVSTKQWIVQHAEKDRFLASLLLSRPGAIKHIVRCIHWDRAWTFKKEQ